MTASALPAKGNDNTLYIVDISSYIFRAYHALPPLSNSKGEPTHAVAGVANMLFRLLDDRQPRRLAVALDTSASVRKERYPEYKANRSATPPDLKEQILRVKEMIRAWNMPSFGVDGYEADDVIATLVKQAKGAGNEVVIVSADKDLLQLVGDGCVMYDTMRDKVFGPEETIEKFGVPPAQVRDLLALTGDKSDNVPGVPSVGNKTAAKLLAEYGDLDGIYAEVENLTRKALKAKLIEFKDDAYLSRELVTLHDDIGLDGADELAFSGPDVAALRELFRELEFSRLIIRLGEDSDAPGQRPTVRKTNYRVVENERDLREVADLIQRAGRCAVEVVRDEEHPLYARLLGLALSWDAGQAAYIPLASQLLGQTLLDTDSVKENVGPMLSNSLFPLFAEDVKSTSILLSRHGFETRGFRFDPSLASYLLAPERHAHGLVQLASSELDMNLAEYKSLQGSGRKKQALDALEVSTIAEVANARVDALIRLESVLSPRMSHENFRSLYYELELPLSNVLAEVEQVGISIDEKLLSSLSEEATVRLAELEKQAHDLAGHSFNIGSPRQLETVLFDELNLPVIKKTKTARSTDQSVLEELAPMHELPEVIVDYRALSKLKSTYLDALPKYLHPQSGRVHTRFNQVVAATGRLSSSDPNLQNIPIRTAFGRRVREAFIPRSGWEMMAADYSQIELRVLAHLSGDKELVDAFSKDADVHRRTASALFGIDEADVSRHQRDQAKTVNFAVIYGQTQFALAKNLKIERAEAKRYIQAFFERYAGVREYMDSLIEEAHRSGYVTTMFGRRRGLSDIRSRNRHLRAAAERIAQNTPIQGSAADIIKRAMIDISTQMRRAGMRSSMLLSVHDELVFEAPADEKIRLESMVRNAMEKAAELSVPLRVEAGWGPHWGAAH